MDDETDALSEAGQGGGALEPLIAESLAERVADRIVQAIGGHLLQPGERLIEIDLAQRLEVSRVPVREALRILQSQGIVRATPRRGVRVIELDEHWASEVRETRIVLETRCALRAARMLRGDPMAVARLDGGLDAIGQAAARADREAINAADATFHTILYELADSPVLMTLWAAMLRHVLIMFGMETCRHTDFDRIVEEHVVLRQALLEGDASTIEREVADHIIGPRAATILTGSGPDPLQLTRASRPRNGRHAHDGGTP